MADYMDLVVVEDVRSFRRLVCRAPWLSHIEVGTRVECELPSSEPKFSGEVVASIDIRKDDESLDFILECANQKGLGLARVINKIEVIKLKYKEEDDAEN